MKNRKVEAKTFGEFDDVFQDPKKLITLTGFVSKKFKIHDVSTTRLMSNYFIFYGLNLLDASTEILRLFINPSKKIGKKKIKVTQNTTLHQVVLGLSQELGMAEFEELFPLQLRSVLENSLWNFKNDGFCFIDEHGNGVSFTQKDFVDLINEFDSNFTELMDEWARRNSKQEL
jgi:hypothetical protein